eukprot:TRINITY_DN65790_c0_g1_i1.p1 TRINITY_DN65790_c0_g1~~TRINITY_DN65790_c0_g1_i1.p1  ORF type:complete len:246 (+),score=73.82 TRINITY_DN65790_c0_g1_i1:75-812(+)
MAAGGQSVFDQALDRIFSGWTVLALAVEQGWGGRDSRARALHLRQEVVDRLNAGSTRKRPPCHTNQSDVEDLANFIYQRLDELFNTEADDSSDLEMAAMCLRLYNTCRAGDASFAQEIMMRCTGPADLSKSQGQEVIQYATDEDQLLDGLQGMDIDEGMESGDGSDDAAGDAPPAAPSAAAPAGADVAAGLFAPAPREGAMNLFAASAAPGADSAGGPGKQPKEEPVVDDDGFEMITKGSRRKAR